MPESALITKSSGAPSSYEGGSARSRASDADTLWEDDPPASPGEAY